MRRQKRTGERPGGNAGVLAAAALCAALAFALYAPTLAFEFVNWDDWEYVTQNPHLGALDLEFARWCLTAYRVGNWHPATLFSYGVDHALWGLDPTGYHLGNALLHGANAALAVWLAFGLFRIARGRASGGLIGAALVGALFAAHPLHVESVAWISERKDVLYSSFWLGSLIAWLGYAGPAAAPRRRRRAYAAALALYLLSALAKPMAVTLPAVLLILDVYPLRRLGSGSDRLRIAVVEKLPFYAISAGITAVTLAAQQASGAIARADLGLLERGFVAVRALGQYGAKWLAPAGLVPLYPLDPAIFPLTAPYWVSLAAVVAAVAIAVALRRRLPAVAACLAFSGVTLLPVLGFVEIGHHSAADRYTYLPMLGPSLLAGAAAAGAWQRWPSARWALVAVAAVAVGGLGWRTSEQVLVWRDSVSLWSTVAAAYPDSTVARYNLGHAHAMAGDSGRAEAEWLRTLELDDAHTAALYELGVAAGRRGEYATARRYLAATVAEDPEHALGRINLAMVLDELGDRAGAAAHYREFLRSPPEAFVDYIEHARLRLAELAAAEPGDGPGPPDALPPAPGP